MSQALVDLRDFTRGDAAGGSQYLTFVIGSELFALPIARVREVIEVQGLTRMPLAPSVVPGVLNLRGAVIPVVDLSVRIGRLPTAMGRRSCIIVVEVEDEGTVAPIGVLVDAVSEALEVAAHQLERRPAFGAGLRADFVSGMLNLEGRFVVVLEVEQLLSMAELEQLVNDAAADRDSGRLLPRERGA
jgi:purine-binding chemotaxis protein CheW